MKDTTKIDSQRITSLFEEIEQRINFLKKIAQTEEVIFLTDHIIFSSAERDLQVAIESCLDIARHLVAKITLEKPKKENKELFLILASHQIIDQDLADKLVEMAGMRNILVHQYMEIHRERVYRAIKYELTDITQFVTQIQKFLDRINKIPSTSGVPQLHT